MIGVCMKYAQPNYGGLLQAQALCKELDKRGIDYELIRYKKKNSIFTKIKYIPRLFNSILISDKMHKIKKKIAYYKHPEFKPNEIARINAFSTYADKTYSRYSEIYVGYKALCKGAEKYAAVVVGSDQLWSPSGLPTNFFNLQFVPDDIRKISVASSFGVNNIPWYQKSRTAEYLNRIDFISMRENRGKEIVQELTGRDVPVIADPVLMLNKQEWEELIPLENIYEQPYIFAYFLGTDSKYREEANKLSKQKGLPIVALRHVDEYVPADENFGDIAPYDITPAQFLNILRNAQYILTDSFHGAVFSVLHEKEFVVFNRYQSNVSYSKNSRIDSFCKNLDLEHRRYKGNLEENLNTVIDYNNVRNNVDKMLANTKEYLDKAFEGLMYENR
ncbi:MAG: polysaccharide pyruvyl transferase family protein [Eubacterium sp.]